MLRKREIDQLSTSQLHINWTATRIRRKSTKKWQSYSGSCGIVLQQPSHQIIMWAVFNARLLTKTSYGNPVALWRHCHFLTVTKREQNKVVSMSYEKDLFVNRLNPQVVLVESAGTGAENWTRSKRWYYCCNWFCHSICFTRFDNLSPFNSCSLQPKDAVIDTEV